MKKIKKILSIFTTMTMALSVIAETPFSLSTKVNAASDPTNLVFDVGEGSVVIGANTITYGGGLTQSYNPASDTVTITGEYILDRLPKRWPLNEPLPDVITVEKDVSVNIIFSNVSINTQVAHEGGTPFKIADESKGNVNITLEGENNFKSNYRTPGIDKTSSTDTSGWLTINGTGSLVIDGGSYYSNDIFSVTGYYNIKINGGIITAVNGFESSDASGNLIINGGSVRLNPYAHDHIHSVFIKNENGDRVYPLALTLNNNVSSILIDGKSYPINRSISNKLYAWVTGESHEVVINGNIVKHYNFDATSKRFVSAEENKFIISPTNSSDTLIDGTDYTYTDGVLTILSNKPITIANTDPMIATITDVIKVKKDISANITLSNVNIEPSEVRYGGAFEIADNSTGDVTITLPEDTINTLISRGNFAGLQKSNDKNIINVGTLTINGKGTLYADSGNPDQEIAAIGGKAGYSASNININDCTIITYWSGIGGGNDGNGSNINIINSTIIITVSVNHSACIGGGTSGNGSNINITNSTITASSYGNGACIGSSENNNTELTTGSSITINDSTITARAGEGACIGGGGGSNGSNITINGGTINAITYDGAGIGGGAMGDGSDITINSGDITIVAIYQGACIGGGYRGNGSNITINGGNLVLTTYDGHAAAIGGGMEGSGLGIDINAGNVTIYCDAFGIGSGGMWDYDESIAATLGASITISGGVVVIRDWWDSTSSVVIGGLSDDINTFSTTKDDGSPGDAWIDIEGEILDNDDTSNWSGVIFQTNYSSYENLGYVYGSQVLNTDREFFGDLVIGKNSSLTVNATLTNDVNVTLADSPGGSERGTILVNGGVLNGSGTIKGTADFLTTELTPDMINTPTNLVYNGSDQHSSIRNHTTLATKTYCNQEFKVVSQYISIVKNSELEYTVTSEFNGPGYIFTDMNNKITVETASVSKPVVLSQSGTALVADFADSHSSYYTQGDTITITGMVRPTGEALMVMALTEPTPGQVVAYNGTTQVSEPVTPAADGSFSLAVPTQEIGPGVHTLTIKYIESEVMAQQTLDVNVGVLDTGVLPADGPIYTFKNTLTTNLENAKVPNASVKYTVTSVDETSLLNDMKSGIGSPVISNILFNEEEAFTNKSISKDVTVDFTDITFSSAGIYRYLISRNEVYTVPTDNSINVDGITADTKDRYLDVYIENDDTTSGTKIAYYVMSEVTDDGSVVKSDGFEDQYNVTNISLTNIVTGTAGDKQKDFTFAFTFDGTTIEGSNIIVTKNGTNEGITISEDGLTYTINLKHNETINFTNMPKNATYNYTVSNNEGYVKTDSIVDNEDSTQITVTHNKESVIPTGVILAVAIPVIVGVAIIVIVIIFIVIKKRDNDDEDDEDEDTEE